MDKRAQEIWRTFLSEIQEVDDLQKLEQIRLSYLGRKGKVRALSQQFSTLPEEEKPSLGREINELKREISSLLEEKTGLLSCQNPPVEERKFDTTLPGRRALIGGEHILQRELYKVVRILSEMGFSPYQAPVIDTEEGNFTSLNFPSDHPARDMQDTFYLNSPFLLRTHTSNMQPKVMRERSLPIRVQSTGRCFRKDDISCRSHLFFHQVDVLYIERRRRNRLISLPDLLSTLHFFLRKLFSDKVQLRMRPSYFPFVEPGIEVDLSCIPCKGKGCSLCKESGWVEILGAGMVHPNVLRQGGIDPEHYSGFAWGMGIERIVLLKYSLPDIRPFSENDFEWLEFFSSQ